ncbi:MAG: hypothetical protein ACR2IH_02590 [Pyrinomonadaceae bacterium]
MKNRLLIACVTAAVAAAASGCSKTPPVSNLNQNTNVTVTVDANNMPPGLSAVPIAPSANSTPGIPPANQAYITTRGATPTPGIPDPKNLGKQLKPGATPTPGIPSEAELRRQLKTPISNVNTNAAPSGPMMMRERKRPLPIKTPE